MPIEAKPRACWLIYNAREIGLADGEHILGREPTAAVWLDSPSVSRHHPRITISSVSATLEDLESKNGVFVGGNPNHRTNATEIR